MTLKCSRKRLLWAIPLLLLAEPVLWYLTLPWPVRLRGHDPERTALMEYRLEEARRAGETLELRHHWVPLDRISRHLQRAVLVAEDARFREHGGVDWAALAEELHWAGDDDFSWLDLADLRALLGAVRYYRAHRDEVRGRSTITQQVAKNLYFGPERSLRRKAAELIVARRLERFLTKDRILEIYLNIAEWGPGIFGAEAAARHYFGRPAAELTREQAAALAATLPHPLTSNPARRPGRMAWRQRMILARMGATGPVQTVPLVPESIDIPEPELELAAPEFHLPAPLEAADTSRADPAAAPPDTAGIADPPPDTAGVAEPWPETVFARVSAR